MRAILTSYLRMDLLQRRLAACDDVLRNRLEDQRPAVLLAGRERPGDERLQEGGLLRLDPQDHVRVRADRICLGEALAAWRVHDRQLVGLWVELPVGLRSRLDAGEAGPCELLRAVLHREELEVVLQRVGDVRVADGAVGPRDHARDTGATACADTGRPVDGGAATNLRL